MAVANKIIDPILLKCAREEFLACGYDKASMNVICKKANVTTGALFKRFSSKEALFYGVVGESVGELKSWFLSEMEKFCALDAHAQLEQYHKNDYHIKVIDIIYDHYEDFKIIIDRSSLLQYSDFLDYFVELETEFTLQFIKRVNPSALENGEVCEEVLHILHSSYFDGIFEVVRHNLQKEDALVCVKQLYRFYKKGWESIINNQ